MFGVVVCIPTTPTQVLFSSWSKAVGQPYLYEVMIIRPLNRLRNPAPPNLSCRVQPILGQFGKESEAVRQPDSAGYSEVVSDGVLHADIDSGHSRGKVDLVVVQTAFHQSPEPIFLEAVHQTSTDLDEVHVNGLQVVSELEDFCLEIPGTFDRDENIGPNANFSFFYVPALGKHNPSADFEISCCRHRRRDHHHQHRHHHRLNELLHYLVSLFLQLLPRTNKNCLYLKWYIWRNYLFQYYHRLLKVSSKFHFLFEMSRICYF